MMMMMTKTTMIMVIHTNLLAKHEDLPTHTPLWVPEAGASPAQDGMCVQVPDMLSACGLDTSSESAFAQATMLALGMSDHPPLPEG